MKKLSYLYEIPIFYLILHLANLFLFPDRPAFMEVTPHPYWLGILLFGFRYGTLAGGASGLISSAFYLTANWFYGDRFRFEDATFYMQPSFFIVVGASVGIGVNKYLTTIKDLNQQVNHLQSNITNLNQELTSLQIINGELEKKIVTRMTTMVTLYQGAQKLESIDLEELLPAILEFFSKTLGVEKAALYMKTPQGWQLKNHYGWESDQQWSHSYDHNQGIVGIAGSTNKIVSIRDFIGPDLSKLKNKTDDAPQINVNHECLIAGPLRRGEHGEVLAVYSIQGMPLLNINSATINLLGFLLGWADRAISRACYFEELKSQELLDPEYNIYSYRYFQTRLKQEFIKSTTYYLPLSICLFKIDGVGESKAREKKNLLLAICQVIKESCRDIDVIARFPEPDIPFVCLFSTLTENQARDITQKFFDNLIKLNLKKNVSVHIGMGSYTPKIKTSEDLIIQARNQLKDAA